LSIATSISITAATSSMATDRRRRFVAGRYDINVDDDDDIR
jgi:hypothetical protein